MSKKKIALLIVLSIFIVITAVCVATGTVGYIFWRKRPDGFIGPYFPVDEGFLFHTPAFTTENGDLTDMELLQIESDVYLYVHKERTDTASINQFNDKYVIYEFSTLSDENPGDIIFPEELVDSTDDYYVLAFDSWVNVYCSGIFDKTDSYEKVEFAVGRLFDRLPAPSEAWMCEGSDIFTYPL